MILESVFTVIAAIFTCFGLFCFVKIWFSGFGEDSYSAVFLENGDDSTILDIKIKNSGGSWLYGRCGVVVIIPESRRTDSQINKYILKKGLKAVYYRE